MCGGQYRTPLHIARLDGRLSEVRDGGCEG